MEGDEAASGWMLSSGRSPRHRRLNVSLSAAGISQSHQDVLDHCDDLHRRLAAVSTQSARVCVRYYRPRALDSASRQDPGVPQLVCQPARLRAHVETIPRVTHPGKTNLYVRK